MAAGSITLVREGFEQVPGLDISLSRAMLLRASDGHLSESFRLNVPARVLAFGKRDALEPGYPDAVAAARRVGFPPVLRLAGGRAAVFHENTVSFTWTVPAEDPRAGIRSRFVEISDLLVAAFGRLGIATEIGEIPGEYCPGEFSINLGGRLKVVGTGQRLASHAAHVGGVIVVADDGLVNEALVPVYAALGLDWDPEATGSLERAQPGVQARDVIEAIIAELATRRPVTAGSLDAATFDLGKRLIDEHVVT